MSFKLKVVLIFLLLGYHTLVSCSDYDFMENEVEGKDDSEFDVITLDPLPSPEVHPVTEVGPNILFIEILAAEVPDEDPFTQSDCYVQVEHHRQNGSEGNSTLKKDLGRTRIIMNNNHPKFYAPNIFKATGVFIENSTVFFHLRDWDEVDTDDHLASLCLNLWDVKNLREKRVKSIKIEFLLKYFLEVKLYLF